MKIKKNKLIGALASLLLVASAPSAYAEALDAKTLLKQKFPGETVRLLKTADLNNDQKKESFLLTESGNLYLVNSKGVVVLIDKQIMEFGEDEADMQIFAVSPTEKQLAVTVDYLPSNTQVSVYRLNYGTLTKKLQFMGDQGAEIDKKGRLHQYWKDFKDEGGGWDLAEGIFTWDAKAGKYRATGNYVLQ
ncbi:hypothetical protein C162_26555 [Paenibacillus sp. FSL R7-269]|uniref:hypothetical protein n=1 Tax=Paenibacillus sp. FSL R7-269 TaxID=1226755 RepID=UPI0003E21D5B|nr:hypothetical protein [Paenibacillus sp. FSL R7-269]ETT41368.1 hypothetical protein C162_26555 [Paenibacillus sp. FSL R7-269]